GVDTSLVTNWTKQANLSRVEGVDANLAFLLVSIGVRNISDLSRLNIVVAIQLMERIVIIDNTCSLPDESMLKDCVENAKILAQLINTGSTTNPAIDIEVSDEKEPSYLLNEGYDVDEIINQNGDIIQEGLGFLDDVEYALPLPHIVRGTVYKLSSADDKSEKKPFVGAKVELIGVSNPAEDKNSTTENPYCYTDALGVFAITMPENYNLQEAIKVKVSQGSNSQTFTKSATDIKNGVPEQATLNLFLYLDELGDRIDLYQSELNDLDKKSANIRAVISQIDRQIQAEGNSKSNDSTTNANYMREQDIAKLEASLNKVEARKEQLRGLIGELNNQYNTTQASLPKSYRDLSMDVAFEKFTSSIDVVVSTIEGANLDNEVDEGFVVYMDAFCNVELTSSALPSVKLMGEGTKAVHLPTDTCPSRVFRYSLLQRLVEPQLIRFDKEDKRKKLDRPIDVMDFRQTMARNPDQYAQMGSLGIGYVLNVHQAWVPDGYALGDLLYSTILAPGEEQRMVVREKNQSYTILDTADATDVTSEEYQASQTDDSSAALQQAIESLATGHADSQYKTSNSTVGFGLSGGYGGVIGGGLSIGHSTSKGSASANSRQSNSYNDASSAAQQFQHSIQSASSKISQAKRISMSAATADESDSVATRIVANNNHSHAMTLQYWEVMRHYRLETCLEGVDLVLYVPLKLVQFLPEGQSYTLDTSKMSPSSFKKRYDIFLRYADTLRARLPYKYRSGVDLIKKYAATPDWELEPTDAHSVTATLSLEAFFLPFDDITVVAVLKNGRRIVGKPQDSYRTDILPTGCTTHKAFRAELREMRNAMGSYKSSYSVACVFEQTHNWEFVLPENTLEADISYFQIRHSFDTFDYTLRPSESLLNEYQFEAYKNYLGKYEDFVQDDDSSDKDKRRMKHYAEAIPEAFISPNGTLSISQLNQIGRPVIHSCTLKFGDENVTASMSTETLGSNTTVNIYSTKKYLRNSEVRTIEEMVHHVTAEVLRYSQCVWSALSDDERAMLLEPYTIEMNYDNMVALSESTNVSVGETERINIPLLNCVNVKKMLGFYGNCMLLPFTYPQQLAVKLGKTAAEIQDALYRYHSSNFRVPTTVISLPTNGMIGEAVLGETNVSEKIDITRFWNWSDSPIEKMQITKDYLNGEDYLKDKKTQSVSALNLASASAPDAVSAPNLLTALASKQATNFDNITGLNGLNTLLTQANSSTTQASTQAMSQSASLASEALKSSADVKKTEMNQAHEKEMKELEYAHDERVRAMG
ncbi:MAG: DUF4332 domain-containing protein, partial [Bacteroidales bacterium]|nr:DUF4332 domain-containing protein [Bacteroidales bacterium]